MTAISNETGSAPVISIFATFPTEPEWERRHERCKTRKEAAACIRDARAKGGFNINVFDPWTKRREAQNEIALPTASATPSQL